MVIQEIMTVTRKEVVTPHYIRVFLTGSEATLNAIANTHVGVNNKIFIPAKGTDKVVMPNPANVLKKMIGMATPASIRRTYTHRGVDLAKKEIWIDFVAHGDYSPASGWAIHAKAGDELGVMMKAKSKPVIPSAEQYLLVGDATAIPVFGAILERLPVTATGQCIIEVHGKEDEQALINPAHLPITWLHNPHPQQTDQSQLAQVVKAITLPTGNRFAYVAGEFQAVKAIRQYLKVEQGWDKNELFLSSYWKAGVVEDESAEDRRALKEA